MAREIDPEKGHAPVAPGEDKHVWVQEDTGAEEPFSPTPHPYHKILAVEELAKLDTKKLKEYAHYLEKREEIIRAEKEDPFTNGFDLPQWRKADELLWRPEVVLHAIFGGNGSGKTFYGARTGVRRMISKPGARVLWLHESKQSSLLVQQPAVWHYIPRDFKTKKVKLDDGVGAGVTSRASLIGFDPKNGFTGSKFVFPNGSLGTFGFFTQDIDQYEGTGWDLIVADENLPLKWLSTLLLRLARRKGKFIWTFTAINGITPAMRDVVEGAVTIESRPAPLLPKDHVVCPDCPPGHSPSVQRAKWDGTVIQYFFSEDNLFSNYEDFARVVVREGAAFIERRAYGYARNTIQCAFPRFSKTHIIAPDRVPRNVSRYCIFDPAGARNCFIIWVAVDQHGRHFVYREWPDQDRFGPWAENSDDPTLLDGRRGPAQDSIGFGVLEYKQEILRVEGARWSREHGGYVDGEEIVGRIIDGRSGRAQSVAEKAGASTSMIDRFYEEQRDEKTGDVIGPSMLFSPAAGLSIDEGVSLINSMLCYDITKPVTPLVNEPKLFVTSNCHNVIFALGNWTGRDGEKGAMKDPVDCVRYACEMDLCYLTKEMFTKYQGTGGTY